MKKLFILMCVAGLVFSFGCKSNKNPAFVKEVRKIHPVGEVWCTKNNECFIKISEKQYVFISPQKNCIIYLPMEKVLNYDE